MSPTPRKPAGALLIQETAAGEPVYYAKFRWQGTQVKRRLGPAWLERSGGHWTKRRGHPAGDALTERAAIVRMAQVIDDHLSGVEAERVAAAERARLSRLVTFRQVAAEWLDHLEHVKGARPSTLRDYRSMLAEPGAAYRRGSGEAVGRIMKALGDRPAESITTRDISDLLRAIDKAGVSARTVNKHRQVLSAIFTYSMRKDTHALASNPVTETDKRREPPPAALDFLEPAEIEALAAAAAAGLHREERENENPSGEEVAARALDDAQDAELYRTLAYTGLRLGEALALRWGDVDIDARRLTVQRAVSAGEEGPTKSWQVRYVPLVDPAAAALEHLRLRHNWLGRSDYVFASRRGTRLDASALRRRFHAAREAAKLRHVRLHDLRHSAGSLVAREMDARYVQAFLGHSKLSTTERYLHAKPKPGDLEQLNRAFSAGIPASS